MKYFSVLLTVASACLASLAGTAFAAPQPAKIPVLIVDGMNNHDWARGTALMKSILETSGRFTVEVTTSPTNGAPAEEWGKWRPAFSNYPVVVNNFNSGYKTNSPRWPREVEKAFEDYVGGGGGLVNVHAANNSFPLWPAYNEMIGLGWRDKNFGPTLIVGTNGQLVSIPAGQGNASGHGAAHDFQITVLDHDHPITRGMPDKWMHPLEQLTHGQRGPAPNLHVLDYAWADDTQENELMDWVSTYGKGRVYTTMLGHLWKNGPDTTLRCVGFQTLLIRGTEWAATGKVTYPVPTNFPAATEVRTQEIRMREIHLRTNDLRSTNTTARAEVEARLARMIAQLQDQLAKTNLDPTLRGTFEGLLARYKDESAARRTNALRSFADLPLPPPFIPADSGTNPFPVRPLMPPSPDLQARPFGARESFLETHIPVRQQFENDSRAMRLPPGRPSRTNRPDFMSYGIESSVAEFRRLAGDTNLPAAMRDTYALMLSNRLVQLADHQTNFLLWRNVEIARELKDKNQLAEAKQELADYLAARLGRIQGKTFPAGMTYDEVILEYDKAVGRPPRIASVQSP